MLDASGDEFVLIDWLGLGKLNQSTLRRLTGLLTNGFLYHQIHLSVTILARLGLRISLRQKGKRDTRLKLTLNSQVVIPRLVKWRIVATTLRHSFFALFVPFVMDCTRQEHHIVYHFVMIPS